MASRRDVLKGLFAASIAAALPDLPQAQAAELAEEAARVIRIECGKVIDAGIVQELNGWWHVWATVDMSEGLPSLHFEDETLTMHPQVMLDTFARSCRISAFVKFPDSAGFDLIAGDLRVSAPL